MRRPQSEKPRLEPRQLLINTGERIRPSDRVHLEALGFEVHQLIHPLDVKLAQRHPSRDQIIEWAIAQIQLQLKGLRSSVVVVWPDGIWGPYKRLIVRRAGIPENYESWYRKGGLAVLLNESDNAGPE